MGIPSRVFSTKYRWMAFDALGVRASGSDRPGRGGRDLETEDPFRVVVRRVVQIARNHEQLPELLLERHPAKEIADAVGDRQAGVPIGWRLRRRQPEGGQDDGIPP